MLCVKQESVWCSIEIISVVYKYNYYQSKNLEKYMCVFREYSNLSNCVHFTN